MKDNPERFVFEEREAWVLGLCRILFFSTLFWLVHDNQFSIYSKDALPLWEPQWIFKFMGIGPLSKESIIEIFNIWLGFLILSAVGLFSTISLFMSFLGGTYILGLEYGYIANNFQFHQLVIALGILSFSRSGQVLSFDQLLRKNSMASEGTPLQSKQCEWALQAIVFCNCMMFFGAALAKLRNGGLEWVSGNFLYEYFQLTDYSLGEFASHWQRYLKAWVMEYKPLVFLMGVSVFLLELLAPLAFFVVRLRVVFLIGFILMFLGVWTFMFISASRYLLPLCFFWLPWESILQYFFREKQIKG